MFQLKDLVLIALFTYPDPGCAQVQNPVIKLGYFVRFDDIQQKSVFDTKFSTNENYNNSDIFKNGNEYQVTKNVSQIVFRCEAFYPVKWTFPRPQQFTGLRRTEFKAYSEKMPYKKDGMWIDDKFVERLHFKLGYQFVGGQITCQAVRDPLLQSGIYLFAEGRVLLQEKFTSSRVNITTKTAQVVLPCRPALPGIKVSLFKEKRLNVTSTEWIPIPLNDSVLFEPRAGFTLDRKNLPDILGFYKCSLDSRNDMFRIIEVTLGDEIPPTGYQFIPKHTLSSDADKIVVNSDLTYGCCSGRVPLTTGIFGCNTESHCDLVKSIVAYDIQASYQYCIQWTESERKERPYVGKSSLLCHTESMVAISHLLICQSPPDLDVSAQFVKVYGYPEGYVAEEKDKGAVMPNMVWTQRKAHLLDISNLKSEDIDVSKKMQLMIVSIIPNRFRGNNFPYRSRTRHVLVTPECQTDLKSDINGPEDEGVSYLELRENNTVHEGENFVGVICFTLRYFYALGGWLQVNFKNGTNTRITPEYNLEDDDFTYMGKIPESDHAMIGHILAVDINTESVECFAPLWNDVRYDHLTLELHIQPKIQIDSR